MLYFRVMPDLTISLVQSDLHWEDKTANLSKLESVLRRLPSNTEVAVLPEMFSTGFSMRPELLAEPMDGPTVDWMLRMSSECRKILVGSLIVREEGSYFNRMLWVCPDGSLGTYDKRHLFGLAGENERYSPGTRRVIASVNGWRVNLCICYDLRFPVWSRQSVDMERGTPEYDLLLYVANWPEVRSHAWKTLLPARAIENQCYVAAVNRVGLDGHGIDHKGHSMVVDPMGAIVEEAPEGESVTTVTLERRVLEETRERFGFWRDADRFLIV